MLAASGASSLVGATFKYSNCDLVVGFRIPGGASDLVVDIGPITSYDSLPAGTSVPITQVSGDQLLDTFSSLNGLEWSVGGAMRGNVNYPQYPLQTIWATSPQSVPGVPGPIWVRKGQFTLGTTAAQIDAIGAGGVTYGSSEPEGPNNSASAIVIPSTEPTSYTAAIGVGGDFAGTFQGLVENQTPDDFDSLSVSSRSVLYELRPVTGVELNTPGKILGTFDLSPEGALTFTAGEPPSRATITSILYSHGNPTISFTTVGAVTYRLRSTDASGLSKPISTWSVTGASIVGNGGIQSLQDGEAPASNRFYAVEAF